MVRLFFILLMLLVAETVWAQDMFVVESNYYPKNDTVLVYKPKGYDSDSIKYSAVVLLHGYGGNYKQWSNITDLQRYADMYKMLIFCPDGFFESWYIDSPVDTTLKYESFFRNDFLPQMFNLYNIDSSEVFITGLSMGGHGALYLFMKNNEVFRAAGSMSGVLDLRFSSVANKSLSKLLGPKVSDNPNWEKYSLHYNIVTLKKIGKPIIVDCGSQDFLIKVNRRFATKCKNLGVEIVFSESDGKHNRDFWKRMLPNQLMYFHQFCKK